MTVEENKQTALRFFTDIWSKGDIDTLYEILDEDFTLHYSVPPFDVNREQMKEILIEDRGAFDNLLYDTYDVVAEGDKVAIQWRMHSKHTAKWQGIEATNEEVQLKGITIFTLKNGKITDALAVSDALALLRQLHAIEIKASLD